MGRTGCSSSEPAGGSIANEAIMILGETPPEVMEQCMGRYRFAAQFAPGRRILDIGCAGGHGATHLAEVGAREVIAVDISKEAIVHAAKASPHPKVSYICADILETPISGMFDMIVAFEVIEHCDDPDLFLSAISAQLNPDGVLLISTPNGERRLSTTQRHPYHHFEWSPDEFASQLKEHFAEVALLGQGSIGPDLARIIRGHALRFEPGRSVLHRAIRSIGLRLSGALGYHETRGSAVNQLDSYSQGIPMVQVAVCAHRSRPDTPAPA